MICFLNNTVGFPLIVNDGVAQNSDLKVMLCPLVHLQNTSIAFALQPNCDLMLRILEA